MDDANNGGDKIRRLQKFIDREPTTIYEETVSAAIPGGLFALTADVRDDRIKIYINGELFTTQTD